MSKVIDFPKKNTLPKSVEDLQQSLRDNQEQTIEAVVDSVAVSVASTLFKMGFQQVNPYDMGLLIDVVRSMVARCYNVKHPFQEMADNTVVFTNEKGELVTANGTVITAEPKNEDS